jgi:mannose-6-phosphate isomerase
MRLTGQVEKGWGHEVIFATTDKYCGKLLVFENSKEFSMHFHAVKDETWYVLDGHFEVVWIDTETADEYITELLAGDTWHNPPLLPHKIRCIKSGTIIEVSTADSVEDNYRVQPGNSQSV